MPPMTSSRPGARAIATDRSATRKAATEGSDALGSERTRSSADANHGRSPSAVSCSRERTRTNLAAVDRVDGGAQAAPGQCAEQRGLDASAQPVVRVADPRNVRVEIERRVELVAAGVGEPDA